MNSISNFQYIWKEWIVPLVNDLYKQIDVEFINAVKLEIRNLDNLCIPAEKYFLKRRHLLKCEYYGSNYKSDDSMSHMMDFHKLGAVLCRTLIQYKVFDFSVQSCIEIAQKHEQTDTDWLIKNALANYRVAFYASIVFLYQSMLYIYEKTDRQIYLALTRNKKLDLYSSSQSKVENRVHESFENSLVLNIAKRDINGRSFDLLTYATLMYQLEKYNKLLIQSR